MEERPKQLKAYLRRSTTAARPDHRLGDFAAAFGGDLAKMEKRYQAFMCDVARSEAK